MISIIGFWKDIFSWISYRKLLLKISEQEEWSMLKLRYDWVNRIYTVINMTKNDIGEEKYVVRVKLIERLTRHNEFLEKQGISDMISLDIEEIPGTVSFLAIWPPIAFNRLNIINLLVNILLICGLVWATFNYKELINYFN